MVRKVGFGDDETVPDSGLVRRGALPKKSGMPGQAVEKTGGAVTEPESEPVAPEPAKAVVPETQEKPAIAPPAPITGKPRWGAIFVLLIVLSTWLAMFGFVVAGMLERRDDGVPLSGMIWVVLSIYGTIVLMRKLIHMYRGGSWLQTPADAARKAGNDTA